MATIEEFNAAAEKVKAFKKVNQDAMLKLYGLFKQANEGDCNTAKPGMLDFKGKAKWEAWNGNKGMTKEAAMEAYVKYVAELEAQE